jgi:endothelin-converting enzyme/putative endopeptidase
MKIFDRHTRGLAGRIAIFALIFGLPWAVSLAQVPQTSTTDVRGFVPANVDRSVRPGDNFFLYANGDWIKRIEIPPDRGGVSGFTALLNIADKNTADIIEEAAKSNALAGSETRKMADLYNSYMDEAAIEKRGIAPLKPMLDAIAGIKDKKELARALGESLRADVDPLNNTNFHTSNLFGLWVAQGFSDYQHYNAYLLQGGLVMPDREYYLASTPHMKEIQEKYKAHIAAMLKLAGLTDADARAAKVYDLEHAIAVKHRSLEDNQDIHKSENPWKQSDFATKAPGLDWAEFFQAAGLTKVQMFNVWQPEAFTGESALVGSEPLDTWKDWLAFHAIESHSFVLPKAFDEEHFDFFGKTMTGTPQQMPRWRRGVDLVNTYLGDAVGKFYAKRYFSPQAKQEGQEMVANIIAAFRKRIDALTWMNPKTKQEAQAKLSALYVGIGYPEKWRDYSKYEVKPDDAFGNVDRARLYEYHFQVDRLGSNVDRHEWSMTPQTVNAVNLPLQIALNFPAAILQPPFFDPKAPAATNYGAMGSVIGHEISHTFDTEGSTFDAQGRLRNWWTPEDLAQFEKSTQRLVEQYDQYKPFPDLSVNGKQTVAENIADVAGLAASYDGYHASLKGKQAPVQAGFTGDQQFFIAFGQSWSQKSREASLRRQVATDEHAPAQYRAETVRNIDAWYPAFDVKPGETLYLAPDQRVRIW